MAGAEEVVVDRAVAAGTGAGSVVRVVADTAGYGAADIAEDNCSAEDNFPGIVVVEDNHAAAVVD